MFCFTLVGYELEPADKRLVEARQFAERLVSTHLNAGAIGFLTPIPSKTAKDWIGLP